MDPGKFDHSLLKRATFHKPFRMELLLTEVCTRRRLQCLATLVVVAIISNLVESRPCSISTCPPGPVAVQFRSQDCSGTPEYDSIETEWGVCRNMSTRFDGRWSIRTLFNNEYQEETRYYDSDNCDTGVVKYIRKQYVGRCLVWGTRSSSLWLTNVNQSFVSPQIPDVNPTHVVPEYMPNDIGCNDPASCLALGSRYQKIHRGSCSSEDVFYFVNANTTMNLCYKTWNGYSMFRCTGRHSSEVVQYLDSNCTIPIVSEDQALVCGMITQQRSTLYCIDGAPTSEPYGDSPLYEPYFPPTIEPESLPTPTYQPIINPPQTSRAEKLAVVSVLVLMLSIVALL